MGWPFAGCKGFASAAQDATDKGRGQAAAQSDAPALGHGPPGSAGVCGAAFVQCGYLQECH